MLKKNIHHLGFKICNVSFEMFTCSHVHIEIQNRTVIAAPVDLCGLDIFRDVFRQMVETPTQMSGKFCQAPSGYLGPW